MPVSNGVSAERPSPSSFVAWLNGSRSRIVEDAPSRRRNRGGEPDEREQEERAVGVDRVGVADEQAEQQAEADEAHREGERRAEEQQRIVRRRASSARP